MKLLLTSVFGPFGVDDAFGRKENLMEVLHNQVTREQGAFSMRFNQESYGLHLIAANLSMPTVILDFPSQRRFIREIKKGYDYIGISFISTNLIKVHHMAGLIRKHAPDAKIILGGHGTGFPDIAERVDCDYVCRGDGVRFMRELLGDDPDAPLQHPIRYSSFNRFILGAPVFNRLAPEGYIMAGVGCVNGCRFCGTSHYFEKKYIPFLKTGQEFFDLCRQYEEQMGITDFFVLDENFLKSEQRSRDLLALMEKHNKAYSFSTFSSAETIMQVGVDFVQRIGLDFIWIGVESQREIYAKNKGVDFHHLVKQLRDRGVSVLTSVILFQEHHTKASIHEDIDFAVSLEPDFIQFCQLGPVPGTPVWDQYQQEGKLIDDMPWEERHGQHRIWFHHPHFSQDESAIYLKDAFIKDYQENGPSILRMADTYLRGAIHSAGGDTPFLQSRHRQRLKNAVDFYGALDVLLLHAPNPKARDYARRVRRQYKAFFGGKPLRSRLYSAAMNIMFIKERIRAKLVPNNMRQPKTLRTAYRHSAY